MAGKGDAPATNSSVTACDVSFNPQPRPLGQAKGPAQEREGGASREKKENEQTMLALNVNPKRLLQQGATSYRWIERLF